MNNEAPEQLFVQMVGDAHVSHRMDPREVHDNGKPVFIYRRVDPPAPADERDKALAREVLNHHYDYPSQKLEFKACLDELAATFASIRDEVWRTAVRTIPTVDQLSRGESITAESFRADVVAALESARTGKVEG